MKNFDHTKHAEVYSDVDGSIFRLKFDVFGWKKAYAYKNTPAGLSKYGNAVLLRVRIPKGALVRANKFALDKCRANRLHVEGAEFLSDGRSADKELIVSGWELGYRYRVGRLHRPREAFYRYGGACASGLHFYFQKKKAIRH